MKLPGVLWLGISAILILITGSIYINSHKNDIKVEEEFQIGSKEMADELSDLTIKIRYSDHKFFSDVVYELENGLKASSTFQPDYYNLIEQYNSNQIRLRISPFDFTSVLNEMSTNMEKERTIRVADYYTYFPINFHLSLDGINKSILDAEELIKIKVPEELKSKLTLENGMRNDTASFILPFIYFDTPFVEVGDAYYFTIANTNELEMKAMMESAVNADQENYNGNLIKIHMVDSGLLEYSMKSGIYKMDKRKKLTKAADMEWIYPLELGNQKDVYVMKLEYMEETNQLLLFTAEEGMIYATILEEDDYRVVGKYEITSYEDRDQLLSYSIMVKGNQISVMYFNGAWDVGGQFVSQMNKISIHECKDSTTEGKLIEEVFQREWSSQSENDVIPPIYDFYLEEDILYLLGGNYVGGYPNGAQIIAMDQNEIRYIRSISDHWKEDLNSGFGGTMNLVGGSSCYISDMMFIN